MSVQIPPAYNFTYVPAGTATTNAAVNASATSKVAVLHAIVVNTKGASANTMTVSDAGVSTIAVLDGTVGPATYLYDVICPNGIRVVSATGTGADYTIVWRWVSTSAVL